MAHPSPYCLATPPGAISIFWQTRDPYVLPRQVRWFVFLGFQHRRDLSLVWKLQAQASCRPLVHAADEKKILQIVAWWTIRVGYELGERAVGMPRQSMGHFIAVQNGAFLRAPCIRVIPNSRSPWENKNKVLETEVTEFTTLVIKSGYLPHRSKSKHSISYLLIFEKAMKESSCIIILKSWEAEWRLRSLSAVVTQHLNSGWNILS